MKRRILPLVAALAAAVAISAVAQAAFDRQTVFTDPGTFTWDGPVATSVAPLFDGETCSSASPAGRYCDRTLVELKKAGRLQVTIDEWNADSDLDLFLRHSDAEGSFGEEAAEPPLASGPGPEKIDLKNAAAGYYLVIANYFQSVESGYKGTVTFTPAGATAPPPGPAATPSPAATPPPSGGGTPPSGGGTPPSGGGLQSSGKLAADVKLPKAKLRVVRSKGLPVTVGCTVTCKVTLTVTVDKATARKLKLGRKATRIGRASATVANKQASLRVKLSAKAKKALKRAKKVKLTLAAVITDSSGGQRTTKTLRATYKR